MRAFAGLGISGLIALVLAEIVKLIVPPLAGWLGAVLLVVLKGLLFFAALSFGLVLLVATFFVGRWVMRKREEPVW